MGLLINSITRFSEGMTQERIDSGFGSFAVAKGFDIFSEPSKLVPTRTTTTDTAGTGIGNLLVGSDGKLYGLGTDSGNPTTNTQLYQKPDNATGWSALSAEKTGSTAVNYDLFIEYPSNGTNEIICAGNGGIAQLDKENVVSVVTHTLAFNSVTQGVIHPNDDILYIPYTTAGGNTYIASNNAGSWNDTALQLPSKLIVTAIAPCGDYLAIACAPKNAFSLAATGKSIATSAVGGSYKSVVYLWGRDTSDVTVSKQIQWGTGILQVLANLNDRLIGISNVGGATTNIADRNSIVIKEYTGTLSLIKEITTTKQTTTVPSVNINPLVNFVYRDRLYFSIDIVGGSTSPTYYGLWALGISKNSGRYAVTIERGATSDNTETSVLAAVPWGDYFSFVHTAAGTLGFSVNNSSNTVAYSGTSYLETHIFNQVLGLRNKHIPDSAMSKKLIGVTVAFEPLQSGATVTLKYRQDSNTAWTTIFTYSTANGISHSAINTESDGANFPNHSEIQFRLESTGGAVITAFKCKTEPISDDIY